MKKLKIFGMSSADKFNHVELEKKNLFFESFQQFVLDVGLVDGNCLDYYGKNKILLDQQN